MRGSSVLLETIALYRGERVACLQWIEETESIGYFTGSQTLEQLRFKRRDLTDCRTAFDSLVLKLEPRRPHFK